MAAAALGSEQLIYLLLKYGAKIDKVCGSFGNLPQTISWLGNADALRLILWEAPDVDVNLTANSVKASPLCLAIYSSIVSRRDGRGIAHRRTGRHALVARLLLAHGAKLTPEDVALLEGEGGIPEGLLDKF